MRVLHISSGNLYGGVETLLLTLARNRYLCPAMEPHFAFSFEGKVSQQLREAGVPVYQLGEARASRPWTIWNARRRLRNILESGDFQFVICHMPWPLAMFGSEVRNRSHLVFWLHNPVSGKHWVERWARRAKPVLAICNSRFTEASLTKLFTDVRGVTCYCPVELRTRVSEPEVRSLLRKQLQTPLDSVVIIQVSRMEAWKGHLSHMHALSTLKDIPNWMVWFVGGAQRPAEEAYMNSLRKAALDLQIGGRVKFLGHRTDVPELLSAADIFCQPNQNPEPFGIVFIEALLARLPVISTALGGPAEIVDLTCGQLVPPGNTFSLAEALREMILSKELRMKLGSAGPGRAMALCDPQTQLAELKQALCVAA